MYYSGMPPFRSRGERGERNLHHFIELSIVWLEIFAKKGYIHSAMSVIVQAVMILWQPRITALAFYEMFLKYKHA